MRALIRRSLGNAEFSVRGEAGTSFWFPAAEHPTFLVGTRHVERDIARDWAALVRLGDVIYDVGANIGFTVHRFQRLLGKKCRIYAFEPIPRNLKFLKRNTGRLRDVTVVDAAVGNRDGRAVMVDNRRHGSLSLLAELGAIRPALVQFWGDVQEVDVAMLTLDAFSRSPGVSPPTFIKLDVEGAALMALQGATHILETAKPAITCSYHSDDERRGVTEILTRYGYRGVERVHDHLVWCSAESRAGHFVHPSDPRAATVRVGAA
jgi:FkbM family methyltransferase